MKTIINLILIALAVTSCSRNTDEPEVVVPIEKTSYNFVYDNSYKVNDIVLYKGPFGVKENPQESIIQNYWSSYSEPPYSKIELNLKNKSLQFHLGKNLINYQVELSNDSICISTDKVFIGILDKKNEKLELYKSLYYIIKELDDSSFFTKKTTELGITKYKDIFGINTFDSPSAMTKENDEVFWANLSFTYKNN
ncbi:MULTISPECIES: hypothetical protein [unclassified Kaistella]|uniref:hypothetical protein n=1 Tax=unclassified Kaistella TaxID=2762626 RepID=UPI002736AE38|nr:MULTISPECIES: hypothetical protein [unclassified Kaistella]MDP2455276.1 hypothetical protein [Kaistella sp. SH11-4b]MDP2458214.1 hypothetical protein [Kaistella sp. SH40-3]MDP2461093.1 hypothetical protein [Kaistella sp. SH19-2b]